MIVASHWILAVFYVMAVTELVTESDIFFRIRLFLTNKFPRSFGAVTRCGYCFSVWAALSIGWCLEGSLVSSFLGYDTVLVFVVDVLIRSLALHRLSNLVHKLYKREWHLVVHHVNEDLESYEDSTEE